MKYMTFNSSCPYAGLANMLSFHGIDTTDRQIALDMGLPYLFAYEDGAYLAGASLQSAKWFDLYLKPRGFALQETALPKEQVPDFLRRQTCAMLGIFVSERTGKHAVVYTGAADGKLQFLNNKWEQEPAPETLELTAEELLSRLDDTCMVATLRQVPAQPTPLRDHLEASLAVLEQYRQELTTVCTQPRPTVQLRQMLNPLFRALLLDGIAMMEVLGNDELYAKLTGLQRSFLNALRCEETEIRLADHLSMDTLYAALDEYRQMIQQKL